MPNDAAAIVVPVSARSLTYQQRFFQLSAALLLLAVVAGFAPTFFLRPATDLGSMHWYLWVHGTVLTGWFVTLLVQTSLVAAHRTDLHRRLGVFGAWVAAAVVVVGVFALYSFPRDNQTGTSGFIMVAPQPGDISGVFMQGFGELVLFAALTTMAIVWRRKIDVHRRLMLMASIAIIFPAAGRIPAVLLQATNLPDNVATVIGIGLVIAYIFGLPLALVGYDLITRRGRPHAATVIPLVVWYLQLFSAGMLGRTPAVQALIRSLE